MSADPNRQGQYPPPQWESRGGAYPVPPQPPPNYRGAPPPPGYGSSPSTPGDMATLPPPQHPQSHPDMYRMPEHMYAPYPPDPRGPPPPHMQYPSQPAPRQRTAIACRYCRRRKIRCSGFDASEDGRCTNCQRFQQECIFTPVSSQAQAFVPAHTAYPHMRPGGMAPRGGAARPLYPHQGQPPIYGAHGQPLGPPMTHDPNYGAPPPGYPMPYPNPVYDERGGPPQPPPPPHGQGQDKSYQSAPYPPPPGGQPYYPPPHQQQQAPPPPPPQQQTPTQPQTPSQPPPRRTSPQSSAYSYDARGSGSPHGSASSASNYQNYPPSGLHPPQVLPPQQEGRTPTPSNQSRESNGNGSAQRGGRSNTDSNMLNALNKKM